MFDKGTDVFHRVVGSCVQLHDVERGIVQKGLAALAFVAGFRFGSKVGAIYRFRQNSGTSGLAHSTRTAKQKCLCKAVVTQSVLQSGSYMFLTYNRMKITRTILAGRYDKVFHNRIIIYTIRFRQTRRLSLAKITNKIQSANPRPFFVNSFVRSSLFF